MDSSCTMEKTKIQMLYEACNLVFSQEQLPTFKEIHWLKHLLGMYDLISWSLFNCLNILCYVIYVRVDILDNLELKFELNAGTFEAIDFGIDEFDLCGSPSSSSKSDKGLICGQSISRITYIHVYECDHFSVSK